MSEGQGEAGTPAPPRGGYAPSPRPTFDRPTLIRHRDATRHVWGDDEAGHVADLIYASTGGIHLLVFELAPGGALPALAGAPHGVRRRRGAARAGGDDGAREPGDGRGAPGAAGRAASTSGPTRGTTPSPTAARRCGCWRSSPRRRRPARPGAYARTKPYLERVPLRGRRRARRRCRQRPPAGHDARAARRGRRLAPRPRRARGVLARTAELTVHTLEINPGEAAAAHAHGGDEVLYLLDGGLWVRAWHEGQRYVFEVEPHDVVLPAGGLRARVPQLRRRAGRGPGRRRAALPAGLGRRRGRRAGPGRARTAGGTGRSRRARRPRRASSGSPSRSRAARGGARRRRARAARRARRAGTGSRRGGRRGGGRARGGRCGTRRRRSGAGGSPRPARSPPRRR